LFIDKVRDIVGLYLNPPDAAIVLCVDEKSQIQALDRSSPVLPMLPGTPEQRTHDCRRHGTTNLYAALNTASGKVISDLTARHRTAEFQRFLNLINGQVPDELDVHFIVDNSSTHKTPAVQRWLASHPASACISRPPTARGSTWYGTVVRRAHQQVAAPVDAPFCQRARRSHPVLGGHLERQPPSFHLAQDR
jgi:hypothetical protein